MELNCRTFFCSWKSEGAVCHWSWLFLPTFISPLQPPGNSHFCLNLTVFGILPTHKWSSRLPSLPRPILADVGAHIDLFLAYRAPTRRRPRGCAGVFAVGLSDGRLDLPLPLVQLPGGTAFWQQFFYDAFSLFSFPPFLLMFLHIPGTRNPPGYLIFLAPR